MLISIPLQFLHTAACSASKNSKIQTFGFQNIGELADLFQQFSISNLTTVVWVVAFPVNQTTPQLTLYFT